MKKMAWITGILAGLMLIFTVLGCVCGAVDQMATDEHFYSDMSRAAVMRYLDAKEDGDDSPVTSYIGLTSGEQKAFAAEMTAFMKGETDEQPGILNEKEQQHMRDVRALTTMAAGLSRTYLTVAAVLAVVMAWTGAKLKKRYIPKLAGMLSAVALVMLIVSAVVQEISTGGFAQVFVKMHETLFTNNLWLMDPARDILIRMMPQPLFEQALLNGANQALRMMLIVSVLLLALEAVIGGMIRRHLTKEK